MHRRSCVALASAIACAVFSIDPPRAAAEDGPADYVVARGLCPRGKPANSACRASLWDARFPAEQGKYSGSLEQNERLMGRLKQEEREAMDLVAKASEVATSIRPESKRWFTVYVSGLSATSSSQSPGAWKLSDPDTSSIESLVSEMRNEWSATGSIVQWIVVAYAADSTLKERPLALIGHSWGGRAVIDVARALDAKGIFVDLLIAIDAVALWPLVDKTRPTLEVPSTVRCVVHVVGGEEPTGKGLKRASLPRAPICRVSGTTHTPIDDCAETKAVVAYFLGALRPSRSVNAPGMAASGSAFVPIAAPTSIDRFPEAVRSRIKYRVSFPSPE